MERPIGLALGLSLGGGLMYVLDPDRGKKRRARVRDKTVHVANRALAVALAGGFDLAHRASGVLAELGSRRDRESVTDEVLAARVRTRLGRLARHPHAVSVAACDGCVTLGGRVEADEVERICAGVAAIPGVASVATCFEETGVAGAPVAAWRRDGSASLPERWSPGVRLAAGACGVGLATLGLRRGGVAGLAALAGGASVLARAAANVELPELALASRGRIEVQRAVEVAASPERVLGLWLDGQAFEHVLPFVRDVRPSGTGRLRWRVRGVGGALLEWETAMTVLESGRRLAWRSVPGSVIEHEGAVRVERVGPTRTRALVHLAFHVPAHGGRRTLAALFKRSPDREVDERLERFRGLAEMVGKSGPRGRGEPGGGRAAIGPAAIPGGGRSHPEERERAPAGPGAGLAVDVRPGEPDEPKPLSGP